MESFPFSELERRLSNGKIGRKIHFFASTGSTNTVALNHANEGAPEGVVIVADMQLKGRGRISGRTWQSPPGKNLYLSVILRPAIPAATAPSISLMAGVALAEVLNNYCPGEVRLKWPNDVLVREKKISGILTEMRMKGQAVDCMVLGIGVNVLIKREEFDPEFREKALSLAEVVTEPPDRWQLFEELLRGLEHWYSIFLNQGFGPVRERWIRFAALTGRRVAVDNRGSRERGEVVGINEEGALLLRSDDGRLVPIFSGDIVSI